MNVEWVTIANPREYQWWERCLAGEPVGFHEDEPHAGFFVAERKLPKSMAYRIPAAFYWSGPVDDTGQLIGDCELCAALAGYSCDPNGLWLRCAHKPITDTEYSELMEQDYDDRAELIQSIVASCRDS